MQELRVRLPLTFRLYFCKGWCTLTCGRFGSILYWIV